MLKQPPLTDKAVERLNKLAETLEDLPGLIKDHKASGGKVLARDIDTFDLGTFGCGTAACAAGVAIIHPWFNNLGLTFTKRRIKDPKDNVVKEFRSPKFRRATSGQALEKFFELTESQADFLFYPDSYPSSHDEASYVALRIRRLIERNGNIVSKVWETTNKWRGADGQF